MKIQLVKPGVKSKPREMCVLSRNENTRLRKLIRREESKMNSEVKLTPLLHTLRDYDKLIDNLNTVVLNKEVVLKDNREVDCVLDSEESRLFKIRIYRRKGPLKISLKNRRGSVISYLSKHYNPNEDIHDEQFTKDEHLVHSNQDLFYEEYLYLRVVALKDSQFTISISFPRKELDDNFFINRNKHIKRKYSNLSQRSKETLRLRVKSILKQRKQKAVSLSQKDFVKRNVEIYGSSRLRYSSKKFRKLHKSFNPKKSTFHHHKTNN